MSEEATITHHHHHHHHHHDSSSNQQSSYNDNSSSFPPQFPTSIEESRVIHHHHESNQSYEPDFPNKNEESGVIHHHHHHHREQPPPPPPPVVVPHYGTFEGVLPSSPSIGFPQPMLPNQYYDHHYQAVPGYVVADGTPVGAHHRLPCCGLGYGWFLFIIGFFMAGVPWYAAAIIFLCCRNAYVDPREKPAYVCCMIFAVLGIITTIFGVMSFDD